MNKERNLLIGFSGIEKEKITTHLQRLLPYLKPMKFVIVGGIAIRYHLLSHGIDYPERPFNDLDLMVKNIDAVSPDVATDFLVYHYHAKDQFLALVDPVTKTKVDIFKFSPNTEPVVVNFQGNELLIRGIEDQLVKTVLDIQRISPKTRVDPKQFSDAEMLSQIADMKKADKMWKSNSFEKWPKSITEAIERANKIAKRHPKWLKEKPFRKPKPYKCSSCQNADGFEIVPMKEVYDVLGYVE